MFIDFVDIHHLLDDFLKLRLLCLSGFFISFGFVTGKFDDRVANVMRMSFNVHN